MICFLGRAGLRSAFRLARETRRVCSRFIGLSNTHDGHTQYRWCAPVVMFAAVLRIIRSTESSFD